MKKMFLTVAILCSSLSISFGGEGDKVKVVSSDTISSQVVFNVHANSSNVIGVDLAGISTDMASLSLIDQNGETLFYKFINSSEGQFEFDLATIKPGIYYVKLNLDSEIRMKLLVVDKKVQP